MAANIKSESRFIRYYDKIITVVVLIGLLVSLYYLTTIAKKRDRVDAQMDSLREPKEVLTPISLASYESATRQFKSPVQLSVPDIQQEGFLIPGRRVQCVNPDCKKPIPLSAEKCPACGKEQPKKAAVAEDNDSDGDGIPDKVEVAWGLDPKNPADAKEDIDNDGFSNLEEYLAKTDPKDAKVHPSVLSLLRVREIRGKKMPFIFSNFNRMPDGFQLVFNKTTVAHGMSAIYAKTNSMVEKTGFQVIKFNESSVKRMNKRKGFMETINTSTVTVRRLADKKDVTLTIGKPPVVTDTEAVIVLPLDKNEYTVVEDATFKIREDTYRVVAIDGAKKTVLIENVANGKTKLVPPVQE